MLRHAVLIAAVVLVVSAMACGGNSTRGVLLITRSEGLVQRPFGETSERVIVPAPPGALLFDPSVSPDGKRIAFVRQAQPVPGSMSYDDGTDLWVAARDGSDQRLVLQHATAGQSIREPLWQDDARVLVIVRETPGRGRIVYTLERVDLQTGLRDTVIEDVYSFGFAPDRTRLAYVKFTRPLDQSLHQVSVDGTGDEVLVPPGALASINAPRYSPDGSQIAFAAGQPPAASADIRLVTTMLGITAAAPPPLVHSAPQDIWLVAAAGGPPQLIAPIQEDNPSVAWGPDGTLFEFGAAGLFRIDPASGAMTRIGDGSSHGQITAAAP